MNIGFVSRCAATLSVSLASVLVHAENLTQAQLWVGGTAIHDEQGASGGTSSSVSFEHNGADGITGSGLASYESGVLTTSAHLKNPTSSEAVYSKSTTRWGDNITIGAEGLNGQTGKVLLSLYAPIQFDVTIDPSSVSGSIHTSAMVYLQLGSKRSSFGHLADIGTEDYEALGSSSTLNKPTWQAEFEFVFGQSIDLQIDVINTVLTSGGVSARVDNWAYWGGIPVVTANGQQVADFSVTSLSGGDWKTSRIPPLPVPEPSGPLLVLAGVGVLALGRKWRTA